MEVLKMTERDFGEMMRELKNNLETGNYVKLSLDECIREAEERLERFKELKNIIIFRPLPGSKLKKF